MNATTLTQGLKKERHFLQNVLKDFRPENGSFRPFPEMMTVAQQINHIAHTTDWFLDAAFGAGFDMDFEKMNAETHRDVTFDEAMKRLDAAYARAEELVKSKSDQELASPLPPNPILGEVPSSDVLQANCDHTAHHRGALTVYLRHLGITPTMVYS